MEQDERDKLRERFLREPNSRRLHIIAATFERIASAAKNSSEPEEIVSLLDQSKLFIEITIPDADQLVADELSQILKIITMWHKSWVRARRLPQQRTLLTAQTMNWANKIMKLSNTKRN